MVDVGDSHDDSESVFRRVFEAEFEPTRRYLVRLLGDPAAASDIAQESFIRLLRRKAMPEDTRAWLITVASNLARNHLQKTGRRRELLAWGPEDVGRSEAPPRPDDGVVHEDTRKRVRAALDSLSWMDRQILLLRSQGYSYQEIATSLEITPQNVGTYLSRARSRFRKVYEEDS